MLRLSIVALIAGCASGPSEEPARGPSKSPEAAERADRPSLVLVTLDTTRADHIGAYGYRRAHTPNIDALAAGGVRFARAYGAVPLTTPTHSSILTGLYPTRHGVHTNGDAVLPEDVQTLAEVLSARGYDTAASVAAFVTTRVWNLDQGFDAYFDRVKGAKGQPQNRWMRERPADEVVDDAIGWLQGREDADRPFFLWVHLYDPHRPWKAPREFLERTGGRPYDAEIAFMDDQVGRLVKAAEDAGGPGGVGWIAVADHGEALQGEHGETDHGMFLFDPTMHVPFIVQPPDPLPEPRVVDDVAVGNVDVMPTALGMLGIPVPKGLDGVDLSPALRGEPVHRPPVYLESFTVQQRFGYHPELAMAEGPYKLFATPKGWLADVVADPGEEKDVSGEHPDTVKKLREALAAVEAAAGTDAGGEVAPEMAEQLAALGYVVTGDVDPTQRSGEDAKAHLPTIRAIERARRLGMQEGKLDAAIAAYRKVMAEEPQIIEARLGLARLLMQKKDLDGAEKVLVDALEHEPHSTVLHMNLAGVYMLQQRFDEAREQAEAVLAQVPGDTSARVLLVRSLVAQGRTDEAMARLVAWEESGSLAPALAAERGMLQVRMGELAAARPYLEASLADDVPRPLVALMLAREATARGDVGAAMAWLRRELEFFPEEREPRWVLANMLMKQSRWDEAAAEYRYIAEAHPDDVDARRAWAQATFNTGDYTQARDILAPALDAAPDNPDVLLLQANILDKLGRTEEGRKLYEEARRIKKAQLEAERAGQSPR